MQSWLIKVLLGVLAGGVAFAFIPGEEPLSATYSHADCRRVGVFDRISGRPLVGIEDLELSRDQRSLYLSSYDRLEGRSAQGGIYQIPVLSLGSGQQVPATPLTDPARFRHGLRPHGMTLSADGTRLAFVNRRRDNTVAIVEGPITETGLRIRMRYRRAGSLCRANDLVYADTGNRLFLTIDRQACDVDLIDLVPWVGTGSVIAVPLQGREDPIVISDGLAFANGVMPPFIAETRGERITRSDRTDWEIALPGGPDNLSRTREGHIIAALHPSLFSLWLYRYGVSWSAPSRIAKIIPLAESVEVLFEDIDGDLFSAATVGALTAGGTLVAGSVREDGLLVCERRG
ncbi:MAG: hypothetical protein AAF713_18270 [Pseudomonadota bacterium]